MKMRSCADIFVSAILLTFATRSLEADPLEHWLPRLPDIRFLQDVTFGNDAFVAVGSSGRLYSSRDGVDWALHQADYAYSFYGVTYGGGQFVALGTFALHLDPLRCLGFSTDGQSWLIGWDTGSPIDVLKSVAYGNDTAVAVNSYHSRLYCATKLQGVGPYWTQVGIGPFADVAYGGDKFVAVGGGGLIQTSFDGKDWVVADSGVTNALSDVAYGNGTYVAVGREGTILRSGDGDSWVTCASPTRNALNCIAFGGGVFLTAGYAREVMSSTSGVAWESHNTDIPIAPTGITRLFKTLTFGGGRFVGIAWDSAPNYLASTSIYQSASLQVELNCRYREDLNGLEVTAQGGLERVYTLQKSTNLTGWSDILVFTNPGPTNVFVDDALSNVPVRFFRALSK